MYIIFELLNTYLFRPLRHETSVILIRYRNETNRTHPYIHTQMILLHWDNVELIEHVTKHKSSTSYNIVQNPSP